MNNLEALKVFERLIRIWEHEQVMGGVEINESGRAALSQLRSSTSELLETLKELLPMWESGINEPWVEAARAAIRKAEGGEA
jgi:hypothetical protein